MVALLLFGCAPRVHLTTLGEPDLEVPARVHVLATTGDGAAADAAAAAFSAALVASPRMRAGDPPDATVSFTGFEALSSDETTVRRERDGEDEVDVFTARRTVAVRGAVALVAADGAVLDRLEGVGTYDVWEAEGPTLEEAQTALPPVDALAVELGGSTGTAYARRVAPLWVPTTRAWYTGGDPRMRAVAWSVRAGDWSAARRVWREVADDPAASDRARARALYDLAVAYELDGDVRRAWHTATDAADLAPTRRIEEYRDTLDGLRADHRPLLERIALPEEAPTPVAPGSQPGTGGGDG